METDGSNPVNANHPVSAPREEKHGFWHSVREWAQVIVIALVIAVPIRFFIAEPFIVNGASMDPTFSTGQFLIVDRLTYRFEEPKRGDVIVFEFPNAPTGSDDVYYIKRIIGLPGERVRIQNGKISIENASTGEKFMLTEPYIEPSHFSHETMTLPENGKPLGPNQFIVMGDNRQQSSDSRVWGPLDDSYIIGRPIVRLTPINQFGLLPGEYHEASTTQP